MNPTYVLHKYFEEYNKSIVLYPLVIVSTQSECTVDEGNMTLDTG